MLAKIHWLSKEDGGRSKPPSGFGLRPYSTVVRFDGDPWPVNIGWSLVVDKLSSETESEWLADVWFLADEAPQEVLFPGNRFRLFEGNKCVAKDVLLDSRAPVNPSLTFFPFGNFDPPVNSQREFRPLRLPAPDRAFSNNCNIPWQMRHLARQISRRVSFGELWLSRAEISLPKCKRLELLTSSQAFFVSTNKFVGYATLAPQKFEKGLSRDPEPNP